jgi:hypothetical protein
LKAWHWLYTLKDDARARAAFKKGEWNRFRIEAIGTSIKILVNGVPTTNMTHDKYSKGFIAFKIHASDTTPPEKVMGHFRNIRIITANPAKYAQQMDILPKIGE